MRVSPKFLLLVAIVIAVVGGGLAGGIAVNPTQAITLGVFAMVISTTLFFWERRVAAAFFGIAILVASHAMTLSDVMRNTELDIIFFLIGMMIVVGVLKDFGFLAWIISTIINRKRMNGPKFVIILCTLAAVLASVVDEVSSIVVVLALVFQVCSTLKLRPHPFVLMSVLATNIGSSATMLGNPVGIVIGKAAGYTFSEFLVGATPIALAALAATLAVMIWHFRRDIRYMTRRMHQQRQLGCGFSLSEKVPYKTGIAVLVILIVMIGCHHQLENLLGLAGDGNRNAFLYMAPLLMAGALMVWRPKKARHYVEKDVEWWTLLFFMLLFSISGAMHNQGITANLADQLTSHVSGGPKAMIPLVLLISSLGSAFVDNIVFVAAFTPVIHNLVAISQEYGVLWWALLFGACFGGNITVVGSTANIVASGLLEKHGFKPISFGAWIRLGAMVGFITAAIAWAALTFL